MKWYLRLIAEAGLGTPNPAISVGFPIALASLLGLVSFRVFSVSALGIAIGLLSLTVFLEWLRLRANRRISTITQAWPEVVDSLVSAFQAGLTVTSAIGDLALFGPSKLRKSFFSAHQQLNHGSDLAECLNWLKVEFSTEPSDRTIELLKLLDQLGGHSSIEVLSNLAQSIRSEIAFQSQLEAKQGWVVTTAKLGLVAPWVVVLMLSRRPENALVYNSAQGVLALLGGLCFCLMAYLAIQLLGTPVKPRRVFANAN